MAESVPSSQSVQQAILQTLYALFLGGVITAFLVVGLNTFYPTPDDWDDQLQSIQERETELTTCAGVTGCTLTPAEQQEFSELQSQRAEVFTEQSAAQKIWSRNAGLVLIGLATGLLALSLIRWDRAIVLSNGLLLGGLFTMVGGIGLTIAAGEGISRFLVLTLALAITVGLGYLRFARRTELPAGAGEAVGVAEMGDLPDRVAALEARLSQLRRALGD